MKITVLTLFPELFYSFSNWSIIGRAKENNLLDLNFVNIRDYSKNKHKKVDDYPYGGGPGMLMTPEPIYDSILDVKSSDSKVIYLSPQGQLFNQKLANELAKEKDIIFLCGHYEGIDNRIVENYVDMEISIGDYVVTGGEVPAMVIIDSLVRLLPNALGNKESIEDESHYNKLLEYPQYTRPRTFNGFTVPDVLLSGNHKKIEEWRSKKSIEITKKKRPNILNKDK